MRKQLCVPFFVFGLALGCNEPLRPSCEETSSAISASSEAALGFSLLEVLETYAELSAQLEWHSPPDWLSLNQSGGAEVRFQLNYDDAQVVFADNHPQNAPSWNEDYCAPFLRTEIEFQAHSGDGALAERQTAELRVFGPTHLELTAELQSEDVEGVLQVSANTGLQFIVRLEDGDVWGSLRAYRQVETSERTNLRLTSIASWEGSAP